MFVRLAFCVVIMSVLLLLGCKQREQSQSSAQPVRETAGNVAEVINVEKRSEKVPNFSWKDNSGKTLFFDAVRGKVTLVNFWATWCGPCKRELPDLVALSSELANRDVKIIGVSTDRGANAIEEVRTFVQEHGIPYQVIVSSEDLEEAFGNVNFLPTSFIVDADGKIVQTFVGPRTKTYFSDALLAVLK